MGEIINQRWISVEDRLPEIGREVLVFGKAKNPDLYNDNISITRMNDTNVFNTSLKTDPYWISPYQYYFKNYTITHWMPFPDSPYVMENNKMDNLIDRSELIECLHNTTFMDGDDRSLVYRIIEQQPCAMTPSCWIRCIDRMPEISKSVLIYAGKHRVSAYWDSVKNVFRLTENENLYYAPEAVTHWMPMPKSPEEDDD